jgi:hypothetical protein
MIYFTTALNFLQASHLVFQAKACRLIRFTLPLPSYFCSRDGLCDAIEENSRTINKVAIRLHGHSLLFNSAPWPRGASPEAKVAS